MNAPTKIQIINGPDGKPAFVVIPYAEYVKEHPAEVGAASEQDEATIPHEVVERMVLEDMTPARAWREYLGLTQAEVASRMHVTQSAYAQMEAAPKNRQLTREKIAVALRILPRQLDV